jgi:hypothetical protein
MDGVELYAIHFLALSKATVQPCAALPTTAEHGRGRSKTAGNGVSSQCGGRGAGEAHPTSPWARGAAGPREGHSHCGCQSGVQ